MLLIHVPNTYVPERSYIIQTLLHDFLGINSEIIIEERRDVLIKENSNLDSRVLRITEVLFQTPENQWLTQTLLPKQPLQIWDTTKTCPDVSLVSSKLPIIYGNEVSSNGFNKDYMVETADGLYLGLDIFGSAFFMLTRYEELIKLDRDQHDRFPATASLAYQEGFLDRPIINEYLEILWYCMKRLWPGLERKKRNYNTIVSHDVDVPFAQVFSRIPQLIRNCGGDIIRRKSPALALQRAQSWQAVRRGDYRQDINYTFDRIMDISEKNGLQSAFYFKSACTDPVYDDNYSIDHPYIRQLLRDIYQRGHEIGLHPSYLTYNDPIQTRREYERLRTVCEQENIQQNHWGGRQHYLRWQVPITWRNWAEAGLNYDSTLSYADHAGFRCGICYEFPVFDLEKRNPLALIERPLIIMEGSVLGEQYMNLSGQEALSYIFMLKERCLQFNGDFTLLWHNSSFTESGHWEMYMEVVTG